MGEFSQAPGFFGKLPSHGDFVGRRLPPEVRDRFDQWLQGALLQSRIDLGEAWLQIWLSSPLWRFVVGPGVCGDQAWAGVMMPSHDRVGRCFPLLIAGGIDGAPSLRDCLTLHDGWFERLEDLALSTLEEGFSLEVFDDALLGLESAIPARLSSAFRSVPRGPTFGARILTSVGTAGPGAAPALADASLDGRSAWWTAGSQLVQCCSIVFSGLPGTAEFSRLLDGR